MIDPIMENRIGLTFVLSELRPRTPWGCARKAALAPVPPDRLDDALLAVSEARVLKAEPLFPVLSRFRQVQGTFCALERGCLSEADLFDLKRFLLCCEALRRALLDQQASARFLPPDPAAPLAVLDPDHRRDPAFSAVRSSKTLQGILQKKAALRPDTPAFLALLDEENAALDEALAALCLALRPHAEAMLAMTESIGTLDFALCRAELADRFMCAAPTLHADQLSFSGLRNPSIPDFCPLDFTFPQGASVLTGANMGGKSTALYTAALNVQLVRMGLFPFAEHAEIPDISDVFLIAGDASAHGLSEFSAQAARLADALRHTQGGALILVDELARGTNPEEGAAIAAAVTEYLAKQPSYSVISTHFSGVAEHAKRHYRALGRMPEPGETPDYRFTLVNGRIDPPRDALRVLARMGVPGEIVSRAKELC